MTKIITDMETWLLDADDRIFRYWVYKKMFTPHEQERKFIDQSCFEDDCCQFAFIEEAIELGNGDWLLGLRLIMDGELCEIVEYYKLNEIKLAFYECDQNILSEDYVEL